MEADSNATITNVRIARNATTVTSPNQDAAAVGAVGIFFSGTVTPTITNSTIIGNTSRANAPSGTATIQGAGLSNNGPLVLTNVTVSGNRGVADGQNGSAQGAGVWNGILFGGPSDRAHSETAASQETFSAEAPESHSRAQASTRPAFH